MYLIGHKTFHVAIFSTCPFLAINWTFTDSSKDNFGRCPFKAPWLHAQPQSNWNIGSTQLYNLAPCRGQTLVTKYDQCSAQPCRLCQQPCHEASLCRVATHTVVQQEQGTFVALQSKKHCGCSNNTATRLSQGRLTGPSRCVGAACLPNQRPFGTWNPWTYTSQHR